MRIAVIVAEINNESAGTTYSVSSLCRGLARCGGEVSLHVLEPAPDGLGDINIVPYARGNFPVRELGRSPEMLRDLRRVLQGCDVVHNNGMWKMVNVYPSIARRGTKCKFVFSPRGGLSRVALRRSRTKKFLMGHLCGQYKALKDVDMFHAASKKELDEIRALGYKQPIALVPNGIDMPPVKHRPFERGGRKIVFFGRIHPTKAVGNLVEAWGRVAHKYPEWSLEIAGPDCGAVPKLVDTIAKNRIPRVSFVGEFHGSSKYEYLASADLYVLPSLTENFGITIAEALACGTPVIASRGCPWEHLADMGCGWWIETGIAPLADCLEQALPMEPDHLAEMGERGRQWMSRDFSWSGICHKMGSAYEWLCNGGPRPDFVYC